VLPRGNSYRAGLFSYFAISLTPKRYSLPLPVRPHLLAHMLGRLFTTIFLLLAALLARPAVPAFADTSTTYAISIVDQANAAVSGVQVHGNFGVNALPGRFSDAQGNWSLDVSDLPSTTPELAFTHYGRGLRFSPASITVGPTACPGRVCRIKAISDGRVSAVVHWSVRDPRGRAYPGMPVIIPRLSTGCPKISDHEGYVLFAVEKTAGTCSDSDASLSNNFYSVLPLSPAGYSCSFTTPRSEKFKACTSSGDAVGFVTATCSYVAPRTIGTSTSYTVQVILEDGRGASAVTFYGTENIGNLANRYPDSTGRWSFSTNQLGLSATTPVTVVPSGNFTFYPPSLTLTPNSCPNNTCQVWAVRNGTAQAAVVWKNVLANSALPLAGSLIAAPQLESCGQASERSTDSTGTAVFWV